MESAVRRYFDAAVMEYVGERERQFSFQAQKALALSMLEGLRGRVLDAGCGPALMAPALLERGFEVWGVDASARMVEAGRARVAGPACHLEVGDITCLRFSSGFFDAALSMGVLEYLPDYRPALRELHRVLKPGGVAGVTVPSRSSPYHLARRLFGRTDASSPQVNRCLPRGLDALAGEAGFRKVEGRGCNFIFFPLYDVLPRASDALNRRLSPLTGTRLGIPLGSQYVLKLQKP